MSNADRKPLDLKSEFEAYSGIALTVQTFTLDDATADIQTRLPDYQLVAAVGLMTWERDASTGTYSPAADYAKGIDKNLVLQVPEEITQDTVKTSLIFLTNGQTLFSSMAPEAIMDLIYDEALGTQRESVQKLERVSDAPSSVLRKAEHLITAPVTINTPDMEVTFRDARTLARSTINDLNWEPEGSGDYKPADKFTQGILDKFGFQPDGNLETYPQSLITLPDNTPLLSTATGIAVQELISRALDERESSLAIINRAVAHSEDMTMPKRQPQPETEKRRAEVGLDVM